MWHRPKEIEGGRKTEKKRERDVVKIASASNFLVTNKVMNDWAGTDQLLGK